MIYSAPSRRQARRFPARRCALLALTLLLILLCFPACNTRREVYRTGIDSFTVTDRGEMRLTVALTDALRSAHEGQTLCLYELRPGETLDTLSDKQPIATEEVRAWTSFLFSHTDGERNRIYSSYYINFSDGTPLTERPVYLTDPTPLAEEAPALPQFTVAKGLNVTATELTADNPNADYASALGCTKGQIRVSLSSLMPGSAISQTALTALDGEVSRGVQAGLSLTLAILPDVLLSPADTALLFDQLADRYATGAHGNAVDTVLLYATESCLPGDAAMLSRMAQLAFASRNAATSVFVASVGRSVADTKAFFSSLQASINEGGSFPWGAGLTPVIPSDRAWETDDTDAVTLHSLLEITQFLTEQNGQRKRPLAITDVRVAPGDAEDMIASLVFAYRTAVQCGASLFFYDVILDREVGLRTIEGDAHPLEAAFASLDRRDVETERICLRAMGEDAFSQLPAEEGKRLDTVGLAGAGKSTEGDTVLFDFSSGEDHGFSPVGNASLPSKHTSSAWNEPVLYTWLNPAAGGVPNGIRRLLNAGELNRSATTLSVDLLTQLPDGITGTLRLTLLGSAHGGRLVRHTSSFASTSSSWQTVNFGIAEFLAEIEESSTVLLTLEVLPDAPCDTSYVLWVRQMRTITPTVSPHTDWLLLGIILGSAVGVCLLSLLLYRFFSVRRARSGRA